MIRMHMFIICPFKPLYEFSYVVELGFLSLCL